MDSTSQLEPYSISFLKNTVAEGLSKLLHEVTNISGSCTYDNHEVQPLFNNQGFIM